MRGGPRGAARYGLPPAAPQVEPASAPDLTWAKRRCLGNPLLFQISAARLRTGTLISRSACHECDAGASSAMEWQRPFPSTSRNSQKQLPNIQDCVRMCTFHLPRLKSIKSLKSCNSLCHGPSWRTTQIRLRLPVACPVNSSG